MTYRELLQILKNIESQPEEDHLLDEQVDLIFDSENVIVVDIVLSLSQNNLVLVPKFEAG